jgi:hypothetical protein
LEWQFFHTVFEDGAKNIWQIHFSVFLKKEGHHTGTDD